MEKRKDGEDVGPALGALAIVLGLAGYGWWQLGEAGRLAWLAAIGHAEGYGPVPVDILAQLEWLAMNRLRGMEGMAALLLLAALAGLIEGAARRQAVTLSGFGLRRLKFGRGLLVLWLVLVLLTIGAPVALPFGLVGGLLALFLFSAMYNLGRGLQRTR